MFDILWGLSQRKNIRPIKRQRGFPFSLREWCDLPTKSNFFSSTGRHNSVRLSVWLVASSLVVGGLFTDTTVAKASEPQSASAISITAKINDLIEQQWSDYQVSPSPHATDGEWCRRVYLDLIGRIPTVAELRQFQRGPKSTRHQDLVRQLLYDDKYSAEFARNWSTIWANLLVGRNGGNERNSLIDRAGLEKYLRDSFARNRAYDAMVMDLLTAEGTNQPGRENFNGAVNFLSMKLAEKATQATADTSRIFLGKQVQCTQCHDHPFNEWKQNQFWELNAFFRQTVALRRYEGTRMVSFVELTNQDFAGEGNDPDEAEVYFELRDATLQAAYPKFIDGSELHEHSGRLNDVNRREHLAKMIVDAEEMPRAIVNRMWAHFFGRGFTKPVDDMGPHNPPTHPELLDHLAASFKANSFDLRLLMEWIATSEPYKLSSRITSSNKSDDPSKGESPLFSHFYVRQMRAEQLYDSLITATAADRIQSRNSLDRTRSEWLKQFIVAFGNDEGSEGSTFDGTIAQSLVLFNGKLIRQALSVKPDSRLSQLAKHTAPLDKKVDQLFLASVARRATRKERNAAKQLVQWRDGDVAAGLQDLWWAILNSNEFILNH